MISLLVLVAAVGLTLAVYIWRRPTSRLWSLAFICLYCLSLGLALRFGGRTYPGIYFPHSPFLNSLLNGNGLFTDIGYDLVLVAGVADTARVLMTYSAPRFRVVLQLLKWLALMLAIIIVIFGFWFAIILERLP
jgi:hypothetical protein